MWVEEQVVGERGVVGNTEEGHEPGKHGEHHHHQLDSNDDDDASCGHSGVHCSLDL